MLTGSETPDSSSGSAVASSLSSTSASPASSSSDCSSESSSDCSSESLRKGDCIAAASAASSLSPSSASESATMLNGDAATSCTSESSSPSTAGLFSGKSFFSSADSSSSMAKRGLKGALAGATTLGAGGKTALISALSSLSASSSPSEATSSPGATSSATESSCSTDKKPAPEIAISAGSPSAPDVMASARCSGSSSTDSMEILSSSDWILSSESSEAGEPASRSATPAFSMPSPLHTDEAERTMPRGYTTPVSKSSSLAMSSA